MLGIFENLNFVPLSRFFDENNSCTIAANDVKAGFDLLQIDVSNDDIEALMNFCFKVSKTRRNKSTHEVIESLYTTLPRLQCVLFIRACLLDYRACY